MDDHQVELVTKLAEQGRIVSLESQRTLRQGVESALNKQLDMPSVLEAVPAVKMVNQILQRYGEE
uniref:Uncharacterized protein n=1 Tax=Magnetococcus massalia (strain MO-1) TaxID=451514 RepID=A0A1S7LEC4_MAGMO|nr:Protein of unknown function [Candidatus Magnetococcus massalia]